MRGIFKKIYHLWMFFVRTVGWVNTRILLSFIYFFIFTSFRIVSIILGKDFLDRKIEKDRESYWQKREIKTFKKESYRKQF